MTCAVRRASRSGVGACWRRAWGAPPTWRWLRCPGFTLPGDISASDRYYQQDITHETFSLNADSTIDVPTGSGPGGHSRSGSPLKQIHAETLW